MVELTYLSRLAESILFNDTILYCVFYLMGLLLFYWKVILLCLGLQYSKILVTIGLEICNSLLLMENRTLLISSI